jgi:transposase, IS5 family
MLRLVGPQVECLFDLGLPVEVPELPADLAAIDALLADSALLEPVAAAWELGSREHGRPSMPIDQFVRLMVVKTRTAGAMRRSCGRYRTRCICGASAGSR